MLTRKCPVRNRPENEIAIIIHLGIRINVYVDITFRIQQMCKNLKALFSLVPVAVHVNVYKGLDDLVKLSSLLRTVNSDCQLRMHQI